MPGSLFGIAISGTIAAVLFLIGLAILFTKTGKRYARIIPVIPAFWIGVALVGVGLMYGGIGVMTGWFGMLTTGTVVGADQVDVSQLPATTIAYCEYKNGVSADGNITIRTDSSRTDLIWLDQDGQSGANTGCADEAADKYVTINITCVRTQDIQEDGVAEIVARFDNFLSETDTTSANEYNVLELKTQASNVWDGEYQQEVYLTSDGSGTSTSASDLERDYLTFAEGVKEKTVTITLEHDKEACQNLNNYTIKYGHIYQRLNGQDIEIFTIANQKIA